MDVSILSLSSFIAICDAYTSNISVSSFSLSHFIYFSILLFMGLYLILAGGLCCYQSSGSQPIKN